MNYREKFESWLACDKIDKETKEELLTIKDDDTKIKERFDKELEFGTAGLRGVMGAGTGYLNVYTVRRATQGLAEFVKSIGKENNGVVIAYDCRNNSALFAKEAALVLSGNGIKTYLFDSLRPTPELSFAVRYLNCASGIVITASHNPKEYNGYKAYGEDGGQLSTSAAGKIYDYMQKVDIFNGIKLAKDDTDICIIGKEIDECYYAAAEKALISPDTIEKADGMTVVYTPFNGAGNVPVREVLKRIGVKNLHIVSEQEAADGNFPTIANPNPEKAGGLDLAYKLAKEKNADLIIATDPDADRIAVACPDRKGGFVQFTGNQIGAILTEYILSEKKEKGELSENTAVVKSIVTTDYTKKITDHFGVKLFDVYTGFKNIAEKMHEFEISGEYNYAFGFEESIGYLPIKDVRDKDGVSTAALICEVAAKYFLTGETLYDALLAMFEKYGRFEAVAIDIYEKGLDGTEKIAAMMSTLRKNLLETIGGNRTVSYIDYQIGTKTDISSGATSTVDFPPSNVMQFYAEDGSWMAFRPSGTEPKLKIYAEAFGDDAKERISLAKSEAFNALQHK